MTPDASVAVPRIYFWNPGIHSRLANEQSVFLTAGFSQYGQEAVVERLLKLFVRHNILSYAVWEIFGRFDVAIQAWLPVGINVDDFMDEVAQAIPGAFMASGLVVTNWVEHWMWDSDTDVAEAIPDINPQHFTNLNGDVGNRPPSAIVKNYIDKRYICRTPAHNTYKFFLEISNPLTAERDAIKALINLVTDAMRDVGILHASIMRVNGPALLLASGRVKQSDLAALSRLSRLLTSSHTFKALGLRTTTHLSALPAPLIRQEQLLAVQATNAVTSSPKPDEVRSLLLRAESDDLEVKASAFTDLEHRVRHRTPERTEDQQVGEVAKAIAGMLNADGGILLIGAAEREHFSENDLVRVVPVPMIIGQRIVLGVNYEYPKRRPDWDQYQRVLAQKLRPLFDEHIDSWVKYHQVKLSDAIDMCVIKIGRPSGWFWVNSVEKTGKKYKTFYGRAGGETRRYEGRELEAFRSAHPRTSG